MNLSWRVPAFLVLLSLAACVSEEEENTYSLAVLERSGMKEIYDADYVSIEGESRSLSEFRGQVLLIVNTASECGYTDQYAGLEELYRTYRPRGLTVIGFPCNQFLGQEPGTNLEIAAFCEERYGVTFPLAAKIEVHGPEKHPLYAWLTNEAAAFPGPIGWNFTKFLVDPKGRVVARFGSSTPPDAAEVIAAIEAALGAK